jgi:hypothetical protein
MMQRMADGALTGGGGWISIDGFVKPDSTLRGDILEMNIMVD